MTLRKQLESLSQQLAELHEEHMDRFDQTLFTIRHAHELALNHHAADAIDIARRVTGPLSPGEGRAILARMIGVLPVETSSKLDPPQVAKELRVSPDTVLGWIRSGQLKASNIATGSRSRWIVQRSDLDTFLQSRQPQPQATVARRKRRDDGFRKYRD